MKFLSICFLFLTIYCSKQVASDLDTLLINNIKISNDSVSLFLVGERHYHKNNDYILFSLIKFINEKANISIIIEEFSPSYTYFVDKFIKEKSDTLLDFILKYGYNEESRNRFTLYKKLYQSVLNQSEFHVLGTSIEGLNWLPFFALKDLAPKSGIPDNMKDGFLHLDRILDQINLPRKKDALLFARNFQVLIKSNEAGYKNLLGDGFEIFNRIINGLVIGLENPLPLKQKECYSLRIREEFIFQNIVEIIKQFPDKNLFGQFGIAHIAKTEQKEWVGLKNWESFAAKLNNRHNSPAKGKIVSIAIYNKYNTEYKDNKNNSGLLNAELRKRIYTDTIYYIGIFDLCKESHYKEFCGVIDYVIVDKDSYIW